MLETVDVGHQRIDAYGVHVGGTEAAVERFGKEIARQGCSLISGACPGLPYAAVLGARAGGGLAAWRPGGLVAGISPALPRRGPQSREEPAVNRISLAIGAAAAAGLAIFYVAVVGGVGGLTHLAQQARADWYWLVIILVGFGTQIAAYAELRRRHRLATAVRTASGTGGGASAVGMVACCAHHVADLAPLIGASGLAVFLTSYRVPIMLLGIAINAIGVTVALRRLRRTPAPVLVGR